MRNPKLLVRPTFFYYHYYYLAFKSPTPRVLYIDLDARGGHAVQMSLSTRPIRIDDAPTPPGYSLLLC